jgi:hypothetical protein
LKTVLGKIQQELGPSTDMDDSDDSDSVDIPKASRPQVRLSAEAKPNVHSALSPSLMVNHVDTPVWALELLDELRQLRIDGVHLAYSVEDAGKAVRANQNSTLEQNRAGADNVAAFGEASSPPRSLGNNGGDPNPTTLASLKQRQKLYPNSKAATKVQGAVAEECADCSPPAPDGNDGTGADDKGKPLRKRSSQRPPAAAPTAKAPPAASKPKLLSTRTEPGAAKLGDVDLLTGSTGFERATSGTPSFAGDFQRNLTSSFGSNVAAQDFASIRHGEGSMCPNPPSEVMRL